MGCAVTWGEGGHRSPYLLPGMSTGGWGHRGWVCSRGTARRTSPVVPPRVGAAGRSHGRATHVEAAAGPPRPLLGHASFRAPPPPGGATPAGLPWPRLPPRVVRGQGRIRAAGERHPPTHTATWERDSRVGTRSCAPRPGVGTALRGPGAPLCRQWRWVLLSCATSVPEPCPRVAPVPVSQCRRRSPALPVPSRPPPALPRPCSARGHSPAPRCQHADPAWHSRPPAGTPRLLCVSPGGALLCHACPQTVLCPARCCELPPSGALLRPSHGRRPALPRRCPLGPACVRHRDLGHHPPNFPPRPCLFVFPAQLIACPVTGC